jgi:hypothetical protein
VLDRLAHCLAALVVSFVSVQILTDARKLKTFKIPVGVS